MALFDMIKPKWKHSDPQVRLQAVKDIDDEKILEQIVKDDESIEIVYVAFNKIEDNSLRKSLIKYIDDQNFLIYIAKNDDNDYVRREAIKKIEDIDVLADIYKKDFRNRVTSEAIEDKMLTIVDRTYNQDKLIDIVKMNNYWKAVEEAFKKITDESAMLDIAKNARTENARSLAVRKITDDNVLKEIFNYDFSSRVRWAVIENINDESFLTDLAENSEDKYIRERAVKKISDKDLLIHIAKTDQGISTSQNNVTLAHVNIVKYYNVRKAANERLKELGYDEVETTIYISEELH